jgi:hypothetical protein
MPLTFQFLAPSLQSTAEQVAGFLKSQHGVKGILAEAEVEKNIAYRPTLVGKAQDHYVICVDVTDVGFSTSLESFVADCSNAGLPVKCYLAFPQGIDDTAFRAIQRKASARGVGVIEVSDAGCTIISGAVPLMMSAVRRPDLKSFPTKFRAPLSEAESTLRSGDAAKACSRVYDEIEQLTRRLAEKINQQGLWRQLRQGEKRPRMNFKTGAWSKLMDLLQHHIDYTRARVVSSSLTPALVAQIVGLVPHRNETGHKPSNKKQLIKRDSQLRTRFEHAVDRLQDVIQAVRPFRI